MIAAPTVRTKQGVVDLVAVDRAVKGDDVPLTDAELLVVIHRLKAQGVGQEKTSKILGISEKIVAKLCHEPTPRDRSGRPVA